ncbi:MAG: tRNA pseudouridine(55) synthase TruB [Phycisphaerales bacterium]|nr:MAG: tRNA pseudouridine(55) synthase TruB [Phycisphaerales bacterium]
MNKPAQTNSNEDAPLSGLLVLDKPVGISSMTAVAIVRRRAGRSASPSDSDARSTRKSRRVKTGHAGTLDPLASGVLVLALGKATKAIDQLMATDKRYETTIDLSAFTTTDDAEGDRTEVAVPEPPSRAKIEQALSRRFTGEIQQTPPAYSAVKVEGQRAYKLARRGDEVMVKPRVVTIHAINLLKYDWPELTIEVHCAKGVYIRALARDLGRALGTGGTCLSIRRTAVGPFTLEMAKSIDELPEVIGAADLLPVDEGLRLVREAAVGTAVESESRQSD